VGLAAPRVAEAQFIGSGDASPALSGFRFRTALVARDTNAQAYGAAATAERDIFPYLVRDGSFVVRFLSNQMIGATKVLNDCVGQEDECGGSRRGLAPVDLHAGTFAIGYRYESVSLFYAASITGTTIPTSHFVRGGNLLLAGPLTTFGSIGAPLLPKSLQDSNIDLGDGGLNGNLHADYIIGGAFDLGDLNVRAGYVGSSGFFSNVTEEKLRLFVSSILQEQFSSLAYLRGGLDRLPLEQLASGLGYSSLFGRKIQYSLPVAGVDGLPDKDLRHALAVDFWSVHTELLQIGRNFQLGAALAVKPSVFLHDLHGGLVFGEPFELPPDRSDSSSDSHRRSSFDALFDDGPVRRGFSLKAGLVELPRMPFYGVAGGQHLQVSALARYGLFQLAVTRNDPELLALFPFAVDAWNVGLSVGFATDRGGAIRR
jgi:hypothetical protein